MSIFQTVENTWYACRQYIPHAYIRVCMSMLMAFWLASCSTHRLNYQQVQQTPTSNTQLQQALGDQVGDIYAIPDLDSLTAQVPWIPTNKHTIVVPRPVPMHIEQKPTQVSLIDVATYQYAFAKLTEDAYGIQSLRVDMPIQLITPIVQNELTKLQAQVTKDVARKNEKDLQCAYLYQISTPVEASICLYVTLTSTYIAYRPENNKDQPQIAFGNTLLSALLTRLS